MSQDPWQDPSAKLWVQEVLDKMVPAMKDSALVASIVPSEEGDVQFWVELGASIMLNKPIIAVLFGDRDIPPKLKLIADEIVRLPEGVNPQAAEDLAQAIKRTEERLEGWES